MAWTNGAAADRVRLGVKDEGVYRVTAGEIAAASGLSSNAVAEALVSGGVSLTAQGRPIAWTASGDALLFYGVPTTELYAPENVYWLKLGAGERMTAYEAAPEAGAGTNAWFMRTESYRSAFVAPYEYKDRRSSNATITNVLIFGRWLAGSPTSAFHSQERAVSLPGFFEGAETGCVARVSAVSYYDFDTPDVHTCEIWLNGTNVGSESWLDEQAVTFDCSVPQGVVTNGITWLKIRNGLTATLNDFLLLDVSLTYPARYAPSNGVLLCTGGASGTLAASGFATPQIYAWDVTEPDLPLKLTGEVTQDTNGFWRAALLCGDAGSRYAVFEEPAGCFEPSVSGFRDTDWSDAAEMPELAIVTPPRRWISGFDAAVQPLADLRNAQGLRSRVIDAEELYNAFTDGLVHPDAFRRFSAAGVTNGASQRLRYMLFAGHAGGDYKLDVFGFGEKGRYPSLFPLYFHAHVEHDDIIPIHNATLYPNDPVLGDVTGDAVPEVAVGRFIATNAVELTYMVQKTIRYELTEIWKNSGLFVACKQLNPWDINFSNFVAQTAAGFEAGGWAPRCYYPKADVNGVYNMTVLWEDYDGTGVSFDLVDGAGLLYYFGHSNDEFLGIGGTVGNYFVRPLTLRNGTWSFAPVALLVGCRIGRWTFLDLKDFRQCVSEAGVRSPASGFAAAVSPAGYIDASEATGYSNGFRDAIGAGALRLGDAYLAGFAAVTPAQAANLRHMTLLGDPSIMMCAGQAVSRCNLTVLSQHGGVEPGTLTADYGSVLTQWITNSPAVFGPTQYVCTGAAVIGNAFEQISPTNVVLALTNDSVLAWQWTTNYLLSATTDGNGNISGGGWYAPGSEVTLVATPGEGYYFSGWSDGALTVSRNVIVPDGGACYTAVFMPIPRGVLRFQQTSYGVSENSELGVVVLKVERVDGSYGAASVTFTVEAGTASPGDDYYATLYTLTWSDGQTGARILAVDIYDDTLREGNETFIVRLADATGATLGDSIEAMVTIVDDEAEPSCVPRFSGDLNFGNVATNAIAMRAVNLWNDGNQPLLVTNVLAPVGFSVTQQVFTVPAGEAVTLPVRFAPTELAAYSGLLVLGCNATSGVVSVAVSGTGVVPVPSAGMRTITGLTAVITIDVPEGANVLGVEDALSPGLIPVWISDDGNWDAVNRKVKWLFSEPGQVRDRAFQYRVSVAGSVITGLVNFGSENLPVTGDTVFVAGNDPGLLHPADDNGDWRVVLNEVAGSLSRWRNGLDNNKTPVVIRGMMLYLQGESYTYDPQVSAEAKRWIPASGPTVADMQLFSIQLPEVQAGAVRSVLATNVTVAVMPETGTSAWGIEESVPEGVQVLGISDSGAWDTVHRRVKWAFFDGKARTLSYTVDGYAGTNVMVAGTVSFDGSEELVSGDSIVVVPLSFQTWASRMGLVGDLETVFTATNSEFSLPNGLVYAFQPNLMSGAPVIEIKWLDGVPAVEIPRQDPSTLGFVDVMPVWTEDLKDGVWSAGLVLAADQSGLPSGRCRWVPVSQPNKAFFRVRAVLR